MRILYFSTIISYCIFQPTSKPGWSLTLLVKTSGLFTEEIRLTLFTVVPLLRIFWPLESFCRRTFFFFSLEVKDPLSLSNYTSHYVPTVLVVNGVTKDLTIIDGRPHIRTLRISDVTWLFMTGLSRPVTSPVVTKRFMFRIFFFLILKERVNY